MAALQQAADQHVHDPLDAAVQHRGNRNLRVRCDSDAQRPRGATAFCAVLNSYDIGWNCQSISSFP
jgi:hypothetical protein